MHLFLKSKLKKKELKYFQNRELDQKEDRTKISQELHQLVQEKPLQILHLFSKVSILIIVGIFERKLYILMKNWE